MEIKKVILISIVMLVSTDVSYSVPAQTSNNVTEAIDQDVGKIMSQILSYPAWDEIDKKDVKKRVVILEKLSMISENNILTIRKAVLILSAKHPNDLSIWSRVFLLNRYIFEVPDKSPIDGNLFGAWVGVPVETGQVNRLWPFSHSAQNSLQLTGQFEGYFGNGYRGIDEFDYFYKNFGLRKK